MIWTLAIHTSVKPGLGRVLNKIIEHSFQISLKLTAISILIVVAKKWLTVAHLSMKNNDFYVEEQGKDHERTSKIPSMLEVDIR